jgi:hypothetical protein
MRLSFHAQLIIGELQDFKQRSIVGAHNRHQVLEPRRAPADGALGLALAPLHGARPAEEVPARRRRRDDAPREAQRAARLLIRLCTQLRRERRRSCGWKATGAGAAKQLRIVVATALRNNSEVLLCLRLRIARTIPTTAAGSQPFCIGSHTQDNRC